MRQVIKVPTSQMEIIRKPQWDEKFGSECWVLKPKGYDAYYWLGSKQECEDELKRFEEMEN